MSTIEVPNFIKNMGNKIISYILNISDEDATNIFSSTYKLTKPQTEILTQFIDICRKLRIQGIDQVDVDFSVYRRLPNIFIENKHIFNIWHEQMGGKVIVIDSDDPIVSIVNRVASKLYPLFLIKIHGHPDFFNKMHQNVGSTIYSLPEQEELCTAIMSDPDISKVFIENTKTLGLHGSYMASTGQGAPIQLNSLPQVMIVNSFELMRMRGLFSLQAFAEAAKDTVEIIRSSARDEIVNVPMFIGFNNLSLNDTEEINTEWGVVRPHNEGISDLVPNNTSSINIDGKNQKLGFVLETTYPYKVNFNEKKTGGKTKWPKELDIAKESLALLTENLMLCFALACERTPSVGISKAWTMVFDPLSHSTDISWNTDVKSPVAHYILDNDADNIAKWSQTISSVDDKKIRLAIRRILSAINSRLDPVDGFIDAVIAWENLFGGNAELSFRISVSIAKLLGGTNTERNELQKKVVRYYNDRSKLLHGVKEVSREDAIKFRDECVFIAIESLKKLYLEKSDLIEDENRSRTLALQ